MQAEEPVLNKRFAILLQQLNEAAEPECLHCIKPRSVSGNRTRVIMFKDLELQWTNHPDSRYSSRQYLDFVVGGHSLRNYLGIKNKSSVTPFGFFPSKEEQKRALKEFRLQQKTQLSDNRIELYVCASCGDIGCGAITAKIIDRGDKIVWTEFANQSSHEEIGEPISVEEIEFDRQNYFQAFSKIH